MTEIETDRPSDSESPTARVNWWTEDVRTTRVRLAGAITVGLLLLGMVLVMIERNGDADRRSDRRTSATANFINAVTGYNNQVAIFASCERGVVVRSEQRDGFDRLITLSERTSTALNVAAAELVAPATIRVELAGLDAEIAAARKWLTEEFTERPPGFCGVAPVAPVPGPDVDPAIVAAIEAAVTSIAAPTTIVVPTTSEAP